jgi:HEAT repeat protein
MSDLAAKLEALIEAERTLRRLHADLARSDPKALLEALRTQARGALARGGEDGVAALVRVAPLLAELHGPEPVDVLVDLLASDEPEVRHAAGEALEDLAFERFKEVALGVERALDRLPVGSPALGELPYLLAEVGEPGCVKLLGRFLAHADADAVASAIEALVELGDPSAQPMLAKLERDTRQVDLDEEGEGGRVTIGELAQEARELLAELAGGPDRGRRGA